MVRLPPRPETVPASLLKAAPNIPPLTNVAGFKCDAVN